MGWKGKAGESNLNKKVGVAKDTFRNCNSFPGLVLVLEMHGTSILTWKKIPCKL